MGTTVTDQKVTQWELPRTVHVFLPDLGIATQVCGCANLSCCMLMRCALSSVFSIQSFKTLKIEGKEYGLCSQRP